VLQGAISGMLGGLAVTLWISIGAAMYAPATPTLPVGSCQHNITVTLPLQPPQPTAPINQSVLRQQH